MHKILNVEWVNIDFFMKLSWEKKRKKEQLNSDSYIIAYNFLHDKHRSMLSAHTHSQATWVTRSYAIFTIWPATVEKDGFDGASHAFDTMDAASNALE